MIVADTSAIVAIAFAEPEREAAGHVDIKYTKCYHPVEFLGVVDRVFRHREKPA
jgi:hypothetical protein